MSALTTLIDLERGEEDIVGRERKCPWRVWVLGFLYISLVLGCTSYLLWEHFAYTDSSPPDTVALFRDISAVVLLVMVIVLVYLVSRRLHRDQYLLLSVMCLYVLCGFYWAWCHFYYESGEHRHSKSLVVSVLSTMAMIYTSVVTVVILLVILSQLPPDAIFCLFFLLN
jgi:hypothetical protein